MLTILLTCAIGVVCLLTEFILSKVWKENEYEEFYDTDYDEQSSTDRNE